MTPKPKTINRHTVAKSLLLGATLTGSLLASACQSPQAGDPDYRGPDSTSVDTPRFATGDFGKLRGLAQNDFAAIRSSAGEILGEVLVNEFGATGQQVMSPGKISTDKLGGVHVRFTQVIEGMELEGAGMVIHASPDGTVFGANGEFVEVDNLPLAPMLDAREAIADALVSAQIQEDAIADTTLAYVLGTDGEAHLAWRATVEYRTGDDPQRDLIFVDANSGKVVARHPQYHYARSLETIDANNAKTSRKWVTVSTSSDTISTGDDAVDSAHNYAIATYDYYFANHGRDSIDDAGMTMISRAHWDRNYNNAYWDGSQMTYGDGDGTLFIPLSQDADVVAHELTHGVTERSSGMIYLNESGALNEAWSDIFGAMVDAEAGGATGADIWLLGEDIYTPGVAGDALRNMADPREMEDYDYYPTRYVGQDDNGGVHSNSGIANLAFVLLSDGGVHPQVGNDASQTDPTLGTIPLVDVPGIGMQAAADIFYAANVDCLTPSATFAMARYCTAGFAASMDAAAPLEAPTAYEAAVNLAWDAVGVPAGYNPPEPLEAISISDGVTLSGQDGALGEMQVYELANVTEGDLVECATSANNGDADLYLRFDAEPEPNPSSSANECGSYSQTSNEACTTGAAPGPATLNALVHAYSAYTNLSVTCTSETPPPPPEPGTCTPAGDDCTQPDFDSCCVGTCKTKGKWAGKCW